MTGDGKLGDIFSPRLLCVNQIDTLEEQDAKGFLARRDLPRRPFYLPYAWKANPFRDNNWMFLISSWRMMDPAIVRYFETGRTDLLERIHAIAADWGQFHKAHPPNQWTWYDMAVGIRALRLALLLQAADDGRIELDPIIYEIVAEHADKLMTEELVAVNNHGIFQMVGLLVLSRWTASPDEARAFAQRKLNEIALASFTKDGIHKEHSPAYHRFVYQTFLKFRPIFAEIPELDRLIRLAAANEPWLTMPDGFLAAIGDTDNGSVGKPFTQVHDRDVVTVSGKKVALKHFSGYAVCRSVPGEPQPFALLVTGAKFSGVHKHADDLSFIFYRQGEPIFIDPGKFAYEYTDTRSYFLSAAAHNTVSVEGADFAPDHVSRIGSSLASAVVEDDFVVITGEITRPGLFSQARRMSFRPDSLLSVHDTVRGVNDTQYRSRLHLHPSVVVTQTSDVVTLRTPRGQTIAVSADTPIEISEGLFSPAYKQSTRCSVLSISAAGPIAALNWSIHCL